MQELGPGLIFANSFQLILVQLASNTKPLIFFLSFYEFSMMFPVAQFAHDSINYWEASGAMYSALLSPELHSKQPITATVQTSARENPSNACYARLGHLLRWQLADDACWQQGCQPLSRAISEEPRGHPGEQDTPAEKTCPRGSSCCPQQTDCSALRCYPSPAGCSPPSGAWSSELGRHVLSPSDKRRWGQRQLFLALTLPAALCS